jgi:CheY-like chemotaxis protein
MALVVLVVDDEVLVRMDAADMLEQAGYAVVEAANADDAIGILESRSDIDIVFSDVQMPGTMDGMRLVAVIRRRWPPIRLILTSGKSLPPDAELPLGAVFIPKPYSYESLEGALAA